jgi:lambda family phage portal protein
VSNASAVQRALEWVRHRLSIVWQAPPRVGAERRMGLRMYHGARRSRLTAGLGTSNTSADSEIATSLVQLRAASRQLVRDASYAKRAKVIVVNNVIGSGVGMQGQVKSQAGSLMRPVNAAMERAWARWCVAKRCHTGGELHFGDLERLALGQVFEAGEVIIRKHYRAFGDSAVPFALEVIEPERLVDDHSNPSLPGAGLVVGEGNLVRMGVEVDTFRRPVAYWLRTNHPGEIGFRVGAVERWERVPADQIFHLRVIERWPQTRGVPWLHTAIRKLNDMDGYSEAEIVAARGASSYMGFIESPEIDSDMAKEAADGSKEIGLEPGTIEHLLPGEKFNAFAPSRPNAAMDPFMRMMLREVAAGIGVSYESLSRDYSQSNYSSSRLALLDDRDLWRVLQQWWIRSFRLPLHCDWMAQAALAGAIAPIRVDQYALDQERFEAVAFKPRGWTWVDPTKEVAAYKEAIKAGLTTATDVIANTAGGKDIEDMLEERANELEMMEALGLEFDVCPAVYTSAPARAPGKTAVDDDPAGAENETTPSGRVMTLAKRNA